MRGSTKKNANVARFGSRIAYNSGMRFPRLGIWITLGCVLLLATIGGAVWVLRGSDTNTSSLPSPTDPVPIAVCFGRVDAPSGVASLHPVQSGRIVAVTVKEGQEVEAGDVLLIVDRQIAEQLVAQAREDVEAAQVQLELAGKLRQQQKLREEEQQAALDVARARVKQAESVLARKKEFVAQGQVNEKDLPPLAAQVEEAQAALRAEERKLDELRLLRAAPRQKPPELRRAEADLAAKRARLRQAEIGLAECELRAPARGTILRVLVSKGDVLGAAAAQPAILFAPDEELIVRAEVEQEVAGKVRVGQSVVIEDDATDAAAWTGKVGKLSRWFAQRRSILLEPGQLNDARTLEAIIHLDSPRATEPPLRIGQRVRVVIYDSERSSRHD
jgi:multidrug resistance efflux pump